MRVLFGAHASSSCIFVEASTADRLALGVRLLQECIAAATATSTPAASREPSAGSFAPRVPQLPPAQLLTPLPGTPLPSMRRPHASRTSTPLTLLHAPVHVVPQLVAAAASLPAEAAASPSPAAASPLLAAAAVSPPLAAALVVPLELSIASLPLAAAPFIPTLTTSMHLSEQQFDKLSF